MNKKTVPAPPAGGPRDSGQAPGRAADVPTPLADAARAILGLYLGDEARDYLGQDAAGRAAHVFHHLVALARYTAPEYLEVLADDPDVREAVDDMRGEG